MPKEACIIVKSGRAACWCFVLVSGDEDFDINVVSRLRDAEIAADAEGASDYNGARKNGKGAANVYIAWCACGIAHV